MRVLRILPSEGGDLLRGIDVSPDGRTLVVGRSGRGAVLFDTKTYQQVGDALPLAPETLAYSPDGTTLVLGGFLAYDGVGYLRLIDARTRTQIAQVRLAAGIPSHLAFTSDGSRLVVVESIWERGSWIAIRDASTLKEIGPPIIPRGFNGRWLSQYWTDPSIALTPDGRTLVTTSEVGELPSGTSTAAELDEDARRSRGLSRARRRSGWPQRCDRPRRRDQTDRPAHVGQAGVARHARVQPHRAAVQPGRQDDRLDEPRRRRNALELGHADSARDAARARGRRLALGLQPGRRDALHDELRREHDRVGLSGRRRFGRPFTFTDDRGLYEWPDTKPSAFSPDGRLVAVALNRQGVRLLDSRTLEPVATLAATQGEVLDLEFSADGQTLAALTNADHVTVWDVGSRSLRWGAYGDSGSSSVSISADGTMLAWGDGDGVALWDVATGASLGRISDSRAGGAGAVAFSPTEPLLALVRSGWVGNTPAEGGGDVELWDVARRSRVAALQVDKTPGNKENVLGWSAAFSPDGRTLATGGIDRVVHLWDVRTRKLIRELEQNVGNAVWALDFTPDGSRLAMSGGDPYASLGRWRAASSSARGWAGRAAARRSSTSRPTESDC